jgi:hypothetical protein
MIATLTCLSIIAVSCEKDGPPQKEPDPVSDFFRGFLDALDTAMAESVIIIKVDNPVGAGEDVERQVYHEIQSRINNLGTIRIIEYPKSQIEAAFEQYGIVPSEGISPQDAKRLAQEFQTDALLYASIESKAPDVYFRLYSGESGEVVFAKTLSDWQMPITPETEEEPDTLDLGDTTGGETTEAGETTGTGETGGTGGTGGAGGAGGAGGGN